jgi:hypothetical protein
VRKYDARRLEELAREWIIWDPTNVPPDRVILSLSSLMNFDLKVDIAKNGSYRGGNTEHEGEERFLST